MSDQRILVVALIAVLTGAAALALVVILAVDVLT